MNTVKEKLYHFEANPPSDMWDKIAEKTATGKVVPMQKRKNTKRLAFTTAAAAIVILLLINFVFLNKNTETNNTASTAIQGFNDSEEKNNELLDAIINAPENKKLTESYNLITEGIMRYFTIEGPEGEPVKISPKVATLIISADNDYPPKPVWNKKIDEWQHIMLTNHVTSASSGLLDIIQQANQTIN